MDMTRERVEALRMLLPAGTRVKLGEMRDPYAPVPPGTKGTVKSIDDAGQIHMKWDNGRSLALIPGVDNFTILPPEKILADIRAKSSPAPAGDIGMELQQNIRDWYMAKFPTDELGPRIRNITFSGLVESMNRGDDVYGTLGVGDSIVRERVFDKTSKILQVDYDVIYYKWLYGKETPDIELPEQEAGQQQGMTMGGMSQ